MAGLSDNLMFPDWALESARTSLKMGLKMPDIEKLLVARGLTPDVASAVVTRALEERVRGHFEPMKERERSENLHRIFSLFVGFVCIVLGFLYGGE